MNENIWKLKNVKRKKTEKDRKKIQKRRRQGAIKRKNPNLYQYLPGQVNLLIFNSTTWFEGWFYYFMVCVITNFFTRGRHVYYYH